MDQPNPNTGPWTNEPAAAGSAAGTGATIAADTGVCPTCGASKSQKGLEQFLGRLGMSDEMVNDLRAQFQDVDIDEYLNAARDYLKNSSNKASTYAKEHPGKVAAGVVALAVGAGLIYASVGRDK